MMRLAAALTLMTGLALSPQTAHADTYCFAYRTATAEARLTLDLPGDDGPVTGTETGSVQDPAQGYFTSWETTITGRIVGNEMTVDLETRIEGHTQTSRENWWIANDSVVTDRNTYEQVPCDAARQGSAFDNVPEHASEDITRGHCDRDEDVILTCEVNDDDVLSVCAARDRSTLAYRFGPVVMPSLELPENARDSIDRFQWHSLLYSGGYDTRISVRAGQNQYVIYERMISRGPNEGKDMEGGVIVYDAGTEIGQYACRRLGEAGIGLDRLADTVPRVAFFDENGLSDR